MLRSLFIKLNLALAEAPSIFQKAGEPFLFTHVFMTSKNGVGADGSSDAL